GSPGLAPRGGGWAGAHEAARLTGDSDLAGRAAGRAEQCRALRRRRLLQALRDQSRASEALLGLADVGAGELTEAICEALRGPPTAAASTALEVIGRLDDPSWCAEVYGLF